MKSKLVIPAGWKERHLQFCRDICKLDPGATDYSFFDEYDNPYRMAEPHLKPGAKILEVGSGFGTALANLRLSGLDAVGIEPGSGLGFEGRYDMAVELLKANGIDPACILQGVGEKLPFPNESFDIVVSSAVLEHVQNVGQCVSEIVRVLKRPGVAVFDLPNYYSWYETHYLIQWIPWFSMLPKSIARAYVRMLGRKDYYINEMNFVTPSMFRRLAKKNRVRGRITLFPFQCLRRVKPIEWVHWNFYIHQHHAFAGRRLSVGNWVEYVALGAVMTMMEVTGLCGGFRATLFKT